MAPQRPIGFWLKLVDDLINEQFDGTLEEHGVTRRQWQLMNVLRDGPAIRPELDQAVAPFLDAGSEETSAEHLEELLESEWVSADGETYQLTDLGTTSFVRLSEVVTRSREQVTQDISTDEYDTTLNVLERMARNLGWNE